MKNELFILGKIVVKLVIGIALVYWALKVGTEINVLLEK